MNTPKELDEVVLLQDFPDYGVRKGDVGTIVHLHPGGAAEVEIVLPGGKTLAVISVDTAGYRLLSPNDVPHVRTLAAS